MVTYQRVSLYFPSETNFAVFNANAFIIFTFLSFPLVGNLSFSEGLRTSRNDNVTAFSTFILVYRDLSLYQHFSLFFWVFVEVSGYNLPKKVYLLVIPPLEKGDLGGLIEVDGGQHYSAGGKEKTKRRDDYMTRAGITVLRFSDREVLGQINAVLEKIWSRL